MQNKLLKLCALITVFLFSLITFVKADIAVVPSIPVDTSGINPIFIIAGVAITGVIIIGIFAVVIFLVVKSSKTKQ